jgi:hypothetical protein
MYKQASVTILLPVTLMQKSWTFTHCNFFKKAGLLAKPIVKGAFLEPGEIINGMWPLYGKFDNALRWYFLVTMVSFSVLQRYKM